MSDAFPKLPVVPRTGMALSAKRKLTATQALYLIDEICAQAELDGLGKTRKDGRRYVSNAGQLAARIYRVAHSTRSLCKHPAWQKAAVEEFNRLCESERRSRGEA